jgi:hypothetical protein
VLARLAADAVCEVHVVPVGAILERQPGGAVHAPAGACWTVAADEGWGVEVAFEAGWLLAWVERVAWWQALGGRSVEGVDVVVSSRGGMVVVVV